jgi:UDP-glucose 4-epimerase
MAIQKILVTGASGFVGSHLCRRLVEQGLDVHAVYRTNSPLQLDGDAIRWWQADLTQLDTVQSLVKQIQPEIIYHLASSVAGSRSLDMILPTFNNNLVSTVNLLTAVAELGCQRFVLAGSLEEPEANQAEAIIPGSPYAAAKWASSAYARLFHSLYDVPIVITRLFMIYGPEQKDLNKLIPYVILSLLRGESPRLSSGERPVDWIYVDDIVSGLVAAAQTPGVEGRTFDLGSGTLVSIRDVVQELSRQINPDISLQFGAIPDRPMEKVQVADDNATYAGLGWKHEVNLKQGLTQTISWYQRLLN